MEEIKRTHLWTKVKITSGKQYIARNTAACCCAPQSKVNLLWPEAKVRPFYPLSSFLLNRKPSTALARFDIRGQPFEKIHYQTAQQHVLRDTSTCDYDVNSLTISVRDEKGNLFDFNGQPLEFELEIN